MEIFLIIVFGFIGAAIGSFVNVCIDRLPAGESIISPPSYCDGCYRRLTALDLVPVFSYIALRGRCRTCGAKIPLRVMLMELFCGIFLALLLWYKGLTPEFFFIAFYTYLFLVIAVIDFKTKYILPITIYPPILAGLIIAPFFIESQSGTLIMNFLNSLAGAGIGAGIILVPVLITRGRGMGFGDVELAFVIGLATGFPNVFVAILGGIILGGIVAIFLVLARLKKMKSAVPFGPFLCLAAVITMIWGTQILNWYIGFYAF